MQRKRERRRQLIDFDLKRRKRKNRLTSEDVDHSMLDLLRGSSEVHELEDVGQRRQNGTRRGREKRGELTSPDPVGHSTRQSSP